MTHDVPNPAEPDEIAGVRAFNRFYTRLVGALDAGMLETPFTLSEARFIYEIGTRKTTSAAELSRALRVDPAYTSRLTFKLVDAGIIAIVPSTTELSTCVTTPSNDDAVSTDPIAQAISSIDSTLTPAPPIESRTVDEGLVIVCRT